MPIGTKNVEFSAIPINLLTILNFLKLNSKNLVGSINYGGGSAFAWGCKSASELGNHHLALIVRHNDESVKEGYIRNGGKEVKLFTSALKAFQCNNLIVMAQRKHLDGFLRGRIIERLECGRTQLEVSEELGITQSVIFRLWQRFQDDGNVSRCYSTGRPRVTTPNEDRYLSVTANGNRRSTASDLSR
ncbi:transposable element Tcb1 transposase [Trichonephila clavipes]|nr:transposable element Tcb1 transposase [Trichonephila clavipes]